MSSTRYEIRLEGHLGHRLAQVFAGLTLHHEGSMTVLTGPVRDQAELHGLLMQIFNLGLSVVSVNRIITDSQDKG